MGFQHAFEFVYLFNLAEDRLLKMPRRFFRLASILFSALPIQTIGQAVFPDLAPPAWNFSPLIVEPRS